MSDNSSENLDWFEYISKLNDRALSKRKASGLTTWAIIGVVAILFLRLIDQIPLLFKNNEYSFFIPYTLSIVINLEITILMILLSFLMFSMSSFENRITSRISKSASRLTTVPLTSILFTFGILNFYVSHIVAGKSIKSFPYTSFGIIFAINSIYPIISKFIKNRKVKIKSQDLPELATDPLRSSKYKMVYDSAFACLSLGYAYLIIISLSDAALKTDIIQNIGCYKFAFELSALIILLVLLLFQLADSVKHNFLESLERKIILENLSPDRIKAIFIQEYLGETTKEWVEKVQSELQDKFKKAMEAFPSALDELNNIKSIDSEYIHEIKGRKELICIKYRKVLDEYFETSRNYLSQVRHLMNQSAFAYNDKYLLDQLIVDWEKYLDQIKDNKIKMGELCKSIGDGECFDRNSCTPK